MSDKPVSSPEVRRAIIVGGGPAGMSLAIALRARGVSSVVLERRTLEECLAQRSSGYDLSPSGVKALKRLSEKAYARVEELSFKPHAQEVALVLEPGSATGQTMVLKANEIEQFEGLPLLTIQRARLVQALADVIQDESDSIHEAKIDMRWGAKVETVAIGARDDVAMVRLATGEEFRSAALVGCDGLHSTVRRAMFGDCGVRSRGEIGFWALLEGDAYTPSMRRYAEAEGAVEGRSSFALGNGHMGLLMTGTDFAFWFVSMQLDKPYISVPPAPEDGWKPQLSKVASSIKSLPLLGLLVFHTEESDILSTMCCDRDPLESFHRGRSLLIGDAAHPFTPFIGQGCSQAFVDSCVLATLLSANDLSWSEYDGFVNVFKQFEKLRLKPSNDLMLESRDMGQMIHSKVKSWLASKFVKYTPKKLILKYFYQNDEAADPNRLLGPLKNDNNANNANNNDNNDDDDNDDNNNETDKNAN